MKQRSLSATLLFAISVIFVCSLLVSVTVTLLRPIRAAQGAPEHYRDILQVAGLIQKQIESNNELTLFQQVETRFLNLESSEFISLVEQQSQNYSHLDFDNYDYRRVLADPEATIAIDKRNDLAMLGRRPVIMPIYVIHNSASKAKMVLPIYGKGMWSMIHGFIALGQDYNTITGILFYQHGETPGIGDRIQEPSWLASWQGKQLYDVKGNFALVVSKKPSTSDTLLTRHQVNAITGATKTVDGIGKLLRFWFGDDGYRPFLAKHRLASGKRTNE